jgi:hypothetical protein
MSYAVAAATKVHDTQVAAATRSQDLVVKVIEKLGSLQEKAPKAPEAITGPLEKVAAPVNKVVGSPAELRSYVARSVRDWASVQAQFQSAVLDLVAPVEAEVEAPKPAKKATSRKK